VTVAIKARASISGVVPGRCYERGVSPAARFSPARPPPVAVVGPSLDELAGEAARAWLIATIEARPLAGADGALVDTIVQRGPPLCAALLRAVGADDDLEWLTGSSEGRALIAGGLEHVDPQPDAVVEAVEALRAGCWRAVAAALTLQGDQALAGPGDRLAHVCALIAATALRGVRRLDAGQAFDHEPGTGEAGPPAPANRSPARPTGEPAREWMAALEGQLAQGGRWGRQFALLLVEVDEAERLRVAGQAGKKDPLAGVGQAVRDRLRQIDVLARENDARLWVIAPGCGDEGALALASRLAEGIAGAGTRRAPLTASVGVSMYPRDGREAAALAERAEEQMFAARAAGVPVAEPE
jgi:diguanylate cyclase (GGDEF)-like protein